MPGASSSSSQPKPAEHEDQAASSAAGENPPESQPFGHSTSKTPSPKIYKSPEELLSKLAPPGCTVFRSYMDSRFTCRFSSNSGKVKGTAYQQVTKTASFTSIRSWQEALSMVHQHSWEKWALLKAELPLPAGLQEQSPGSVPQDTLMPLHQSLLNFQSARGTLESHDNCIGGVSFMWAFEGENFLGHLKQCCWLGPFEFIGLAS